MSKAARQEAMECIRFYERRGWDWSIAVSYILAKHTGLWDWMNERYWRLRTLRGQQGAE